jgi:hypothetical protein
MNTRIALLASLLTIAATSLAGCGGGKSRTNAPSNNYATTAPMTANGANQKMPNCGATQAVWVNLNTKVYHEPGDPAYGHTRNGEYLCPSQATAQGFRAAGRGGERRHRRHHRRTGMEPEAAPTSTY